MITRSVFTFIMCCGFFIFLQSMVPKAIALKKTDVREYMFGEQRTRRRQNYVEKMALDNELYDNMEISPPYLMKSGMNGNKEELPALIVDYANMIRNDIILLDNSMETRTRKRGNVKVEKHNKAIPDACSCAYNNEIIDLGENYTPRYLENRTCSQYSCRPPLQCHPNIYYELTILKRRTSLTEVSAVELPSELKHRWVADNRTVVISCMCTRDYIVDND